MHSIDFSALNPAWIPPRASFSDVFGSDRSGRQPGQRECQDLLVLHGKRILLVEDEVIVATDIELELADYGAEVVGPVASVKDALEIVHSDPNIHAAILDVSIVGGDVYPAAEILAQRNVPMLFHTGHATKEHVQARFPQAKVFVKPQHTSKILTEVINLVVT